VRKPPLARLCRARGNIQEARYGTLEALSRPTITTTAAEPESDATVASIGCGWATPSERATFAASARCPLAYSTTVTWFAPGGLPASALARAKPLWRSPVVAVPLSTTTFICAGAAPALELEWLLPAACCPCAWPDFPTAVTADEPTAALCDVPPL